MSITLRQISKRADGSDIVRSRRIEADEATIGRSADCEIVLPDLAVAPLHARLKVTGGRVSISGEGGAKFQLGGKQSARADFDAARGAAVEMGDHRLTFEPGAHPGEVTLTVTRVREATGGVADPTGVFSIRPGLFGKRRTAWVLATAVLLITLAWPIAAFHGQRTIFSQPDAQWTVGHLSKAHAFLEDDCQACHQKAFVAVRDEACMTCHAAGADQAVIVRVSNVVKAKGSPTAPVFIREHALHARLMKAATPPKDRFEKFKAAVGLKFGRTNDRCVSCHLEHKGPVGFAPADQIHLPLTPTLQPTDDCASCHGQLKHRLPDTPLIDTPDWPRHPDFRAMNPAQPQTRGLNFSHAQHLQTTGGVARQAQSLARYGGALNCADCHHPATEGPGFAPVRMEQDCEACHSLAIGDAGGRTRLPHAEPARVIAAINSYYAGAAAATPLDFVTRRRPGVASEAERASLVSAGRGSAPAQARRAIQAAFSPRGICFDCHLVTTSPDAPPLIGKVDLTDKPLLTRGRFDHRTPGHRSTDPGALPCAGCHAAESSQRTADLLMPHIAVCATCHGKRKEEVVQAAGAECSTCHSFHAPALPTRKPDKPSDAIRIGAL